MRYTFDIKSKKDQTELDDFLINRKGISPVDKYEPMERISKQVEKLGLALRQFKASGMDWDVFHSYLRGKGHSNQAITAVMGDTQKFFKSIGLLEE